MEFDILQKPTYEALSYTWGDERDKLSIIVDGEPLDITMSLFFFLRQLLEQLVPESETMYLWADQISINQEDTTEKAQQVALMADIYRQSQRTRAWLGDLDQYSHLVMSFLGEMEPVAVKALGQVELEDVYIEEATIIAEIFLAKCGGKRFTSLLSF
jgi:hypothetical protein